MGLEEVDPWHAEKTAGGNGDQTRRGRHEKEAPVCA